MSAQEHDGHEPTSLNDLRLHMYERSLYLEREAMAAKSLADSDALRTVAVELHIWLTALDTVLYGAPGLEGRMLQTWDALAAHDFPSSLTRVIHAEIGQPTTEERDE